MKKILFLFPDRLFNDFIKSFLEHKGFTVMTSRDNVEGLRFAINFIPDLIISNKEFPNLDATGFLIKKRTLRIISAIPVFLIGDFSPDELFAFKKENVKAFLSTPLNPTALTERINILSGKEVFEDTSRTPMLLDMHVKANIITIQIEGNFEPEKLELCNYLIRSFCIQKNLKKPKIFIIVPHLYPESITVKNLKLLLKFTQYREVAIDYRAIKVLTNIEKLINTIRKHEDYNHLEVVHSFADGILSLQMDFDKEKTIPVAFIKSGSSFIFDLYDDQGKKLIPALTRVTDALLAKINKMELRRLTYYSDREMGELLDEKQETEGEISVLEDEVLFDMITEDFEPIESELHSLQLLNEKRGLFFRRMKGQEILIITKDQGTIEVISNTLDIYFHINYVDHTVNVKALLDDKRFAIVFIDATLAEQGAIHILQLIRQHATRRKTSAIILTRKIDKVSVIRYRSSGTNNILLIPFSTSKILQTVFDSVSADRKT